MPTPTTFATPGVRSAATTGATIMELMARLGHSSPRAAMIYQHAATATIAAILVQFLCNARVPKTRPE